MRRYIRTVGQWLRGVLSPREFSGPPFGEEDVTPAELLEVEPDGQNDTGPCSCCGDRSRVVWGFVHGPDRTLASYHVHRTLGRVAEQGAHFDVVMGAWGEWASARDRVAVALECRLFEARPAFMVIDAGGRPAVASGVAGRGLRRVEVVGRPIASQAFAIVDAVLAQDTRVAGLKGAG